VFLVIDNYDSFTYNLVQYLGELGAELRVERNDAITLDEIGALKPQGIILGPGPGTPKDAGITLDVIRRFGATTPILGVCLGHQAIGEAYGGSVIRAPRGVMHGKSSRIAHNASALFKNVPNQFEAMRYHSLVVEATSFPDALSVTATAVDDATEIHALQHRTHPVFGVQFHPESIGTAHGKQILSNFLQIATKRS
jgi:anthranilate synthase component 2